MKSINRDALRSAIEGIDTGSGAAENLTDNELFQQLYPVPSQARAFNLDKIVVIGGRGTGKTHIFRALLDKKGREAVVKATGVKLIHDVQKMVFVEGFSAGLASSVDHPPHPSADGIEDTLGDDTSRDARRLWLGVCMARLSLHPEGMSLLPPSLSAQVAGLQLSASNAREIRAWVDADVERPFMVLDALDRAAASTGQAYVFTFDALDRAANAWDKLATVVGGLLSIALDVSRRCRAIRFKVFLRPDIEADAAKSFPDASKLRGYQEHLVWERSDLYRLAFKRMMAHPTHGAVARALVVNAGGNECTALIEPLGWTPTLKLDESIQKQVMTEIAGPYMGANAQKGVIYTWVPNHLADAHRRVSPRSLLVALSTAAKWFESKPAGATSTVLTPNSIAEGVKAASEQRVIELEEDFPWIGEVKKRLAGLLVPCHAKDVIQRLKQCDFRGTHKGLRSNEPRLVLEQLVELGIFLTDPDGRYNVPDLYRVAMNMKRKGGIRVAG